MKARRICLILILILSVAGCGGETNQQVIDRYKPQFATKREQLKQIASKLPPARTVTETKAPANLDPKPVYDPANKNFNTDIVMAEHLLDPDIKLGMEGIFDLILTQRLLLAMQWTGPRNPMSESVLKQRSGHLCTPEEFDKALTTRYLVVLRTTEFQPPTALNESTYQGGLVEIEGMVFDLRSNESVAAFRVRAEPAEHGTYTFKTGEDAKSRMKDWVGSSMWTNARKKVGEALRKTTGGTFDFDK